MELVGRPLADVFVEVGVFVGSMLALFAWLERRYGDALTGWLARSSRAGPLVGAVLGVVPGCGGAIVVMPMYLRGSVSFGTVVAALVATMGDSSFVLIAADPGFALVVHGLLFVSGVVSGVLVDLARLAPGYRRRPAFLVAEPGGEAATGERLDRLTGALWLLIAAGLVFGVPAYLGLVDAPLLRTPVGVLELPLLIGLAGVAVAAAVLVVDRSGRHLRSVGLLASSGRQTAFVVVLVAVASLVTTLPVELASIDVATILGIAGFGGVIAGALVGLVPGCAPQILLTGLYVSGAVPVPTLVANAASQDGDALFPLLALARRPALVAAALTTLPGLAVGGAWLVLM